MPVLKLAYVLLGVYWLAVLLFLVAWRQRLCGHLKTPGSASESVVPSRETEARTRYFKLLLWVLVLAFMPVYTVLTYARFRGPMATWLFVFAGVFLTIASIFNAYRQLRAIHRLSRESEANTVAGRELAQIRSFEDRVFQDLPGGQDGCIDHVVVGPAGVFAIDTATHSHRILPTARKADWLQAWLAIEAREYVNVRPVHWFIGGDTGSKDSDAVVTVNAATMHALLRQKRILSPTRIHRIAARLESMARFPMSMDIPRGDAIPGTPIMKT